MPQLPCPHCPGSMRLTKRLTFPDGGIKLVYECSQCQRASILEAETGQVPSETP